MADGEFKKRCLTLLDQVRDSGQEIVITKRGKPVARLVPVDGRELPALAGSVLREGDLVSPIDAPWDAEG